MGGTWRCIAHRRITVAQDFLYRISLVCHTKWYASVLEDDRREASTRLEECARMRQRTLELHRRGGLLVVVVLLARGLLPAATAAGATIVFVVVVLAFGIADTLDLP